MPPLSFEYLLEGEEYSKRKELFQECRKKFKSTPGHDEELIAYEQNKDDFEYRILKGLIPEKLVGTRSCQDAPPWVRSDTFFTNYAIRYPHLVLSTRPDSLIICNLPSHDTRLYLAQFDPECKDKTASAGMSYMHLLVIPRKKVFNIVSLNNTECIDEMISHFQEFWAAEGSIDKANALIKENMNRRYQEVMEGITQKPGPAIQRTGEFEKVMDNIKSSTDQLASELQRLKNVDQDFFFSFHPFPHTSIGHLHMHVLPKDARFREYSTEAHDWKTIPVKAVKEVIQESTCQDQPGGIKS